MSGKKQHYVSEFVLRNFADDRGQLYVLPIDGRPPFHSSSKDLAHENNAYTLVQPAQEGDALQVERKMALLESAAAPVIADLVQSGATTVPFAHRDILEHFIAMHAFRHPVLVKNVRANVQSDMFGKTTLGPLVGGLYNDALVESLSFPVEHWLTRENEPRWEMFASEFAEFTWAIQRYRAPSLILADRMVARSGKSARSQRADSMFTSTFGFEGLATCMRITVPLAPRVGLILSRGGRVRSLSAEQFNRTTVRNSRAFIACHPELPTSAPSMFLDVVAEHSRQLEAYKLMVRDGLA